LNNSKEVVVHYVMEHYTEFIENKPAIHELGVALFSDIVSDYHKISTSGSLTPLPEQVEPKDTLIEDMKSLYDKEKNSDISFKLVDPNALGVTGTVIKGHRAIVVGRAPGLSFIVNSASVDATKGIQPAIVKGISPEAFEATMRWIYYNETSISTVAATELVKFCKDNKLIALEKICVQNIKKDIRLDNVLTVLDASYIEEMPDWYAKEMADLKPKCVEFAYQHLKEMNFEQIRSKKMHAQIASDILEYIQQRESTAK